MSRWPSAAIRLTRSGFCSAHLPVMPKVAGTPSVFSTSRIREANPVSAPASKVRATMRRLVLPRLTMVAGVPVVAGGPVVVGRGGAAVDVGVDVVVVGIGGTVVGGAVMAVVEVRNGEVVAGAGDAEGRPAQPPAARASTTAIRHRRRVGDASTVCDTTGMRRRTVAGLGALALALSLTACSSGPTGAIRRAGSAAGAATTVPAGDPEAAAAVETVPARAPDALDPAAVRTPGGIVVPVLGREGGGWKVSTPCGRDAVVASATRSRRRRSSSIRATAGTTPGRSARTG